jgi:putative endonuclease
VPRTYRFYVYILASLSGTLYIGVTNSVMRRVGQHKQGEIDSFTKTYGVNRLVYFEEFTDVRAAILREKQLKGWSRAKKVALVESKNPQWVDVSREWYCGAFEHCRLNDRDPSTTLRFALDDKRLRGWV